MNDLGSSAHDNGARSRTRLRGWGIRITRILGIDISIDPSWGFVFLLATWSLGGAFVRMHPGWSAGLVIGMALAGSLLFFASAAVHELSHAVSARSRGLTVRHVSLFLFGGISNVEREPPSPRTDLAMAIVGPFTSASLGIFCLFLGRAEGGWPDIAEPLRALAGLDPLATIFVWLGAINLSLAILNVVPAFPLDGGRVLRAGLWAATGNLERATRWAAAAGRGIGLLFIFAGIAMALGASLPFLGVGAVNGIWLAFIGWSLETAAAASYRQVLVDDLLEEATVGRLMRKEFLTITPDTTVADLVDDRILGSDDRAFPVVEWNRLAGMVSLEDVRKISRAQWESTIVRSIMTPAADVSVATPGEDAAEALREMGRREVRQLPVVEQGRLVGLLRRRDIVRWLQLRTL